MATGPILGSHPAETPGIAQARLKDALIVI